jgi:hypothetical protein
VAAKIQLNNFRFSIYIDADGTVTLTDLPPELREVVEALDPSHTWGTMCPIPRHQRQENSTGDSLAREDTARDRQRGDGHG